MWKCKNCSEQIENNFDNCWNCSYSRVGLPPKESNNVSSEAVLPNGELLSLRVASSAPLGSSNFGLTPQPKSGLGVFVPLSICAGAILSFLLFFHVVPASRIVFPKAFPSFADTFVNLDDYLRHYNSGNFIDKIAMRQTYLFQKLMEKGLLVKNSNSEGK